MNIQRFLLLILICFGINFNAYSQLSPYSLELKKDLPLAGVGGLGLGLAFLLQNKVEPLTEAQVAQLNIDNVLKFDRWSTRNWNPSIAKASDIGFYASAAIPLLLMADKDMRNDAGKLGVIYLEVFSINAALTTITKALVKRTRPYAFNPNVPLAEKLHADTRMSFYSGHTSVSASFCFMTAQMFSDYNPNSKYKPLIWAGSAAVPAFVGLCRILSGKHYPSDVIIGYLTGALVGVLVPRLHRGQLF